eukprot:TRINITY_DN27778_c0_g1_i1.p1 TRINITY_DN27778_c0_g1~~TRINITY_DN27778_c0_g1_i1.p1  ORF type:complete len:204 (+),score=41.36 TRINITY_DN27778_c0_g1_i1:35-646(+)
MLRWTGGTRAELSKRHALDSLVNDKQVGMGRALRVEVVEPIEAASSNGRSLNRNGSRKRKEENLDILSMFPPKPKKRKHQVLKPIRSNAEEDMCEGPITAFREAISLIKGRKPSRKQETNADLQFGSNIYHTPGMKASNPVSPSSLSLASWETTPPSLSPAAPQYMTGTTDDGLIDRLITNIPSMQDSSSDPPSRPVSPDWFC